MAKPSPRRSLPPRRPARSASRPWTCSLGDRLADETGEWEVIGLPYSAAGGKIVQLRVQRAGHDRPAIRTYGAHERVSVQPATAEEGKR